MKDYRKFIKSRNLRMAILSGMEWIPDSWMVRLQYFLQTGKKLHLKKPVLFNEKMQAYKLFYRDEEMLRCTDKVEVRQYVKEKGLEEILVPLYAIGNNLEEIDFENLPKKFVIKTSDGGGGNEVLICKDKATLDKKEFESTVARWLSAPKPKKHIAREWAYQNRYPRRLIVEQLLENLEDPEKDIEDYKFFCFNGKVRIMQLHKDRHANHKAGFWDENLEFIRDVNILYPTFDNDNVPELPENIWEMVEISEKLSKGFPYVRVDLYNIDGKIFFSELTFYPASGYIPFNPESFNKRLGTYFQYPFKP